MDKCAHAYCRECWRTNFLTKLNNGDLMRIKCLDYCCTEQCPETIIKSILSEQEFDKYVRFTNAFKVDTNRNLIFCPSGTCQELIDKRSKPIVCLKCQTKVCAKCDLTEHDGRCVR